MMSLLALIFIIFVVGCVDYKAYDLQKSSADDNDLVNEIAEIEKELAGQDSNGAVEGSAEEIDDKEVVSENKSENVSDGVEGVVVEEVALPELQDGGDSGNSKEIEKADKEKEIEESVLTLSVKENDFIKLSPKIVDPDDDPITFTFSKPLNEKGEWKTNYGDAGEYVVTLRATDGKLSTEKKIKIVVERVNVPPKIGVLSDITAKEGQVIKFQPNVTDPNKDPVTVVVSDPLKNGMWETDHTSAGEYNLRVTASDGELESAATFKLTVVDVNQVPVIKNVAENLSVKEGDVVMIKPQVTDLDEDKINLTISDPVGNGGVWETSFTDHGDYVVTVTASDGKGSVSKRVRLVVEDVNKPPEIVDVKLSN